MKKNETTFVLMALLIVLFTEIDGINSDISTWILAIFDIIAIIIFNIKLKNAGIAFKRAVPINLITLGFICFIGILFIGGSLYQYGTIALPILILCMFFNKINFFRFDKQFLIDITKYFILPSVLIFAFLKFLVRRKRL